MRTPDNPLKLSPQLQGYKRHRVIMPVYIPNQEGYYRDAFKIFQICLNALVETTRREDVNITIIDNASISEVGEFVRQKLKSGDVDQYVYNSQNRGKADTIVGIAKASYEEFVTFSDADVLFVPGWIQKIESIYQAFPHAGVVCPFPAPHLKFHYTASTWIRNLFAIRFRSVVHKDVLDTFEVNLGIENFFKGLDKQKQFFVQSKGVVALVGAGHFVATYRTNVFKSMNYFPTQLALKGGLKEIEKHVDVLGFSRLSITENFVLHMGNVYEEWMDKRWTNTDERSFQLKSKRNTALKHCPYFIRGLFLTTIFYSYLILVKLKIIK